MMMMACGQIVNYAWREGIDAEEVEPVFDQAMTLARKLKDMRAAALITMAFGRVLAATGSADEYVAKVQEAQRIIDDQNLPSVKAVLSAVYSHALSLSGRYEQALSENALALKNVHKIDSRDRQTLGFHPEHWLTTQRARTLVMLNRSKDAELLIDKLLNGNLGEVDTLHHALALGARIEGAARAGNSERALAFLPILDGVLKGNETPYLRVLRGRVRGTAYLASGDAANAASEIEAAIDFAQRHRAGLEMVRQLRTMLTTIRQDEITSQLAN